MMGVVAMLFFPVRDVLEQLLLAAVGLVILVIGRTAVRERGCAPLVQRALASRRASPPCDPERDLSRRAGARREDLEPGPRSCTSWPSTDFNLFQTLGIAETAYSTISSCCWPASSKG